MQLPEEQPKMQSQEGLPAALSKVLRCGLRCLLLHFHPGFLPLAECVLVYVATGIKAATFVPVPILRYRLFVVKLAENGPPFVAHSGFCGPSLNRPHPNGWRHLRRSHARLAADSRSLRRRGAWRSRLRHAGERVQRDRSSRRDGRSVPRRPRGLGRKREGYGGRGGVPRRQGRLAPPRRLWRRGHAQGGLGRCEGSLGSRRLARLRSWRLGRHMRRCDSL
mmetsp:Transcript_21422/g.43265  ORF Transcript_21422/g.43265 Transcript_21422/m.43265 type:complete len:221 (-) Transcript_21422:1264-1926(-)